MRHTVGCLALFCLAGCGAGRSVVDLDVTSGQPITGIDTLRITATIGGAESKASLVAMPAGQATIPPDVRIAVEFDKSRSGPTTLKVEALGGGKTLASAQATVELQPSGSVAATVVLMGGVLPDMATADLSRGIEDGALGDLSIQDLTATPDVAEALDTAMPADIAAPLDAAMPVDMAAPPDTAEPPDFTVLPTCNDKLKNQGESDVDCGGKSCPLCAPGKVCIANADCATARCNNGRCALNLSFGAMSTFAATGVDTIGLAAGDINADGKIDLAIANHGPQGGGTTVNFFLGNGNGTVQGAKIASCAGGPFQPSIGDLNGDKSMDLAVPAYGGLGALLGDGQGNFGAPKVAAIPENGGLNVAAALADLNVDGKLDAVLGDYDGNNAGYVDVLLGKGDGTFNPPKQGGGQVKVTNVGAPQIAIADVNGDKVPDVLAVAGGNPDVRVLIGKGDGTLMAPYAATLPGNWHDVIAADLDGDASVDLVATDNANGKVAVLYGNGKGTFPTIVTMTTGANPYAAAVGDLNGDGFLDVAVPNGGGSTLSLYLSNGNRTYQMPTSVTVGKQPDGLVLIDFDGDGKLDIAVDNSLDRNVGILLNTSSGS